MAISQEDFDLTVNVYVDKIMSILSDARTKEESVIIIGALARVLTTGYISLLLRTSPDNVRRLVDGNLKLVRKAVDSAIDIVEASKEAMERN